MKLIFLKDDIEKKTSDAYHSNDFIIRNRTIPTKQVRNINSGREIKLFIVNCSLSNHEIEIACIKFCENVKNNKYVIRE